MKKIWLGAALFIVCAGCVSVKIPKYLKDEFPYKKKFYASFDETLTATQQALLDNGWHISDMSSPSVFEQDQAPLDPQGKQILIFTEMRQTPIVLTSRYMSLNVYLLSADNSTDVEIRYLAITPMLFKNMENYKNDAVVNKIFDRITELVKK